MPEPNYLHVTDDVIVMAHEPGNGTRYLVVISETNKPGRWCVSFPDFGSAYWVEEDQMDETLHWLYVAEKWRINGHHANQVDAVEMAAAIYLAFKPILRGQG